MSLWLEDLYINQHTGLLPDDSYRYDDHRIDLLDRMLRRIGITQLLNGQSCAS